MESGTTPPLSCRSTRPGEQVSARQRTGQQVTSATPHRSPLQTPPHPRPGPTRSGTNTLGSTPVTRSYAAPPAAGSGGTPAGSTLRRAQPSRSSLPLPNSRRLSPSASATSLRGTGSQQLGGATDAGSGGTGDASWSGPASPGGAGERGGGAGPASARLATSRSTPSLDMRAMSTRSGVGHGSSGRLATDTSGTPNANTPRLAASHSARSR